jgi:DnaJ-class molecular chaperone
MLLLRRFTGSTFAVSKFNSQQDYYKVLGLTSKANSSEIKRAFKELAKKHHPDATRGSDDKFKEINEAYQILSDEKVRQEYDSCRH